jgi:Fur family ferric uptake transcriptional regulator
MSKAQHSSHLHKAGLKATSARILILQLFEQRPEQHLSAEEVHRRLSVAGEEVGLATVYRILSHFAEAGLLVRHNFEEGHSLYERAADGHHDHMVDLDSGQIIEFVDDEIEALQKRIAERHGYDIVSHNLVLFVRSKKTGDPD